MNTHTTYFPAIEQVQQAAERLRGIVNRTPLQLNRTASETYGANIYLKREDLQQVRSYKIRGAYNKMATLNESELAKGVVCASAGNHAQGVALACNKMQVHGTIFMPTPTPGQKLEQVKMFGGDYVTVVLAGDTFDEAKDAALDFCDSRGAVFIHPFDDPHIIEGQATVGLEVIEQLPQHIDYVFVPIGGGGLASGLSSVFRQLSPDTKIIGVEPTGAPSMKKALEKGEAVHLDRINKFVDGAAVQKVGNLTFEICRQTLSDMLLVDEGRICQVILSMYNKDAIVAEPAGALSVAALEQYREQIAGKNVVCIISGSNNDITRMEEIKEGALLYAGLKHYFIVKFPQRPGALREFVMNVLGPTDDITHFEYTKKNSKEKGTAVVGIELKQASDFDMLLSNMKERGFYVDYLNNQLHLLNLLV
ncbi:threonine dehydratase [Flavobacterium akiainvivens]|uniref:L-threonine dehydratase n=1 Tax=Flavobacterium akiainvivens TaxID=1202724 RepID=A0A0M8ME22_9FLAO|nr:threonine ammonia-lyase IlvA [Flavobacterium akiainvivens]KOS08295.1 threonine dehydratase [Flavobacterium akiainvivens]